MNKAAARKLYMGTSTTWAHFKALLASADRNGASIVNPQFTKEEILRILEKGIEGKPDNEIPGRGKWRSGDNSVCINILRETA